MPISPRISPRITAAVVAAPAGIALLALAPGAAQAAKPLHPERAAVQRQAGGVLHAGARGVVVGVRRDGRSYAVTAGVADTRTRRPVAPAVRYRIGSVSKTFLATVVVQLAGERRLGLDDPLDRYLPGVLPRLDEHAITLRMLLDHTSGTPDPIARVVADPSILGSGAVAPSKWLELAREMPPTHAPGARFSYSNTDYALLAMVVEKVTGAPYQVAERRRILQPLRLRRTLLPSARETLPAPALHGYVDGRDTTRFNASWAGAAGGIVSTVGDVNRFAAALAGGRLVPRAVFAQMRGDAGEAQRGYGLGVKRFRTRCGTLVFGHDGAAIGYTSRMVTTADGRVQVSVGASHGETPPVDAAIDRVVDAAVCG